MIKIFSLQSLKLKQFKLAGVKKDVIKRKEKFSTPSVNRKNYPLFIKGRGFN